MHDSLPQASRLTESAMGNEQHMSGSAKWNILTCRPAGSTLLQEVQEAGLSSSTGSLVLRRRLTRLVHALQLG